MLKQVQHDNRRGFTLIELLVVVLIIGVLAAVAVPQYNKVVRKNRLMKFQIEARSIFQSMDMYQLANGKWPEEVGDLDVWDSVSDDKTTGYLNGRSYQRNGGVGSYFRTYVPISGIRTLTCDFWVFGSLKNGNPWGECYTYDAGGKELLESLNWKVWQQYANGTNRYYIPQKGFNN